MSGTPIDIVSTFMALMAKLDYDADKDFWLFSDRPKLWCPVPPGVFAIFFPEDVHAPLAAAPATALRKAVVKVAVDWNS